MAGYAVDPDELRRGDAALGDNCGRARAAVGRLRASADDLFGAGWSGPAAAQFRAGWERWLSGAHQMLAALDELAVLVGSAGVGYASAEAAVRADVVRTPG